MQTLSTNTMSSYYNQDTMPPLLPFLPKRTPSYSAYRYLRGLNIENLESCLTIWQSQCRTVYKQSARRQPTRSVSDSQMLRKLHERRLSDSSISDFKLPIFSKPLSEKQNKKPVMFSTLIPTAKSTDENAMKKNADGKNFNKDANENFLEGDKKHNDDTTLLHTRKEAWDNENTIRIPHSPSNDNDDDVNTKSKHIAHKSKTRKNRKSKRNPNKGHGENISDYSSDEGNDEWSGANEEVIYF